MNPNQDKAKTTSHDQYLTREEAMRFLRVSRTTLTKVVRQNKIPVYKLTRRPLFLRSDLVAALDKHKTDHKNKTNKPAS